MAIELPKIEVSESAKRALAEKHGCTLQSVRNALKYFSNSEQAQAIRKSAKAMLIAEAEAVSIKVK